MGFEKEIAKQSTNEAEILEICPECKKKKFVVESEGIGCGFPEKHYPIGYCKNCDKKENE